jgi:hypothetical protein
MSTQKILVAAAAATFFIASCADYSPQSEDESKKMADSCSVSTVTSEDYVGDEEAVANSTASPGKELENLRNETEFLKKSDSIGMVMNTSAASLNILDSTHLFIRTADVRCRVDEVANSTYRVEKVVNGLGGYVSNTQLASTQTWQQQTQVSNDSIKQVTRYVVSNTVTIRVPAKNLDSLLSALVPLVDYMDYRNVTVNDITLEQLSKQLEQARLAKYNAMLQDKIVDETNKPDKIMNAADAMLSKQEQSDYALIESLRLKDQVAYATLSLQLYQPETSATAMIFHEKPTPAYEIGIGERIGDSLYAGWKGFSYIISGFVLLWPLWLIAGIVFYMVRRQMRKAAKAA